MPCGVCKSSIFHLPETQTKLTKLINPPGTWRRNVNGYYLKMRKILTIFILGLFCVCTSSYGYKNIIGPTSIDNKAENGKIPIAGCWVSENYFHSIKKNKSQKNAQNNSLLIIIPEKCNEKTTIMENFHDDFEYFTILKNHSKYEVWEIHDYQKAKFYYTIEVISSTKIKIGDTILVKIDPLRIKDFYHNGLKNEILVQEELLFKGEYITSDNKKVVFKKNGEIIGLDGFYYYAPNNDYYDEGSQVDQVCLIKSEKNIGWKDLENYGYKFNKDTLELYKIKCVEFDSISHNCGIVEFGELKYKLRKTNNNR